MRKFFVAFPILAIMQTGGVFVCAGGEGVVSLAKESPATGMKNILNDETRGDRK